MYIDTHCHLNGTDFDEDRATVIGNAKKAGVKKFINPGDSIQSSQTAIALMMDHPGIIYAAAGCHPYDVTNYPRIKNLEKIIEYQLAINRPIVAIGECGLDYHPYKGFSADGKKTEQKQLFEEQLLLALKYHLPVIIHCRDAFEDIFPVLDTLPSMPQGVFHCFSGGGIDVRSVLERGFFIGLDGNATYSKQLAAVIPDIPLSRLLLETDAPYLPPEGHRGERSEPKYIPLIAKKIALLQQTDTKKVEEQTTANATGLFHLDID